MDSEVFLPLRIDRITVVFAIEVSIDRTPNTITAKGRAVIPVLEPTKRVLILLPGSNPPFIVQTVTSCFTDKTVLRLIKPKVQREQIKVCVIHGRNVLSVVPTPPSILKSRTNAIT